MWLDVEQIQSRIYDLIEMKSTTVDQTIMHKWKDIQ